jgi:hypothetical protein
MTKSRMLLRDARQQVNISFKKCTEALSVKLAASAGRRFEFHKRRQHFIGTHNEAFSVVAMRVTNERRDFLEILNTRVRWQGPSG